MNEIIWREKEISVTIDDYGHLWIKDERLSWEKIRDSHDPHHLVARWADRFGITGNRVAEYYFAG